MGAFSVHSNGLTSEVCTRGLGNNMFSLAKGWDLDFGCFNGQNINIAAPLPIAAYASVAVL